MSTTKTHDRLRPSMLPKLALCGHYRAEEEAGEAANRGTKLDAIFRDLVAAVNVPLGDLLTDEREAVLWARDTARALAGGLPLFSSEEALRVEVCGLTGTADLLCEEGGWSADLKTGQKRNYREQQAAYALGFMDQCFADEWTVYLLYCDLQEVDTLRFTREEAEALVRGAIANAHDASPPTPNEYCGWCARRFDCPARKEAVSIALKDGVPDFASATSDQLREFALRAAVVEDYAEKARELLKERMLKGEKVAGCSLVSKRGARKLPWQELELRLKRLGTQAVLSALGDLSEAKAKPLFDRVSEAWPEDKVQELPGSTYVRVGRPKP